MHKFVVMMFMFVLALGFLAPSQSDASWEEWAVGILVAERLDVVNLSGIFGESSCDQRCQAEKAYRQGLQDAQRDVSSRVSTKDAYHAGYCEHYPQSPEC